MAEIKDTTPQEVRAPVTTREVPVLYSNEDQATIKLIGTMLDEAGSGVGTNRAAGTQKEKDAYTKLHASYRNLMELRGQAFLDAFGVMVVAATKFKNTIFSTSLANRNLDKIDKRSEREAFMIFVNMLIRFARSTDKGRFASMNNVERLATRFTDPELQHLIRAAFLAA